MENLIWGPQGIPLYTPMMSRACSTVQFSMQQVIYRYAGFSIGDPCVTPIPAQSNVTDKQTLQSPTQVTELDPTDIGLLDRTDDS